MSYNYMHVSVPIQHLYIYNKYYLCVQSITHTGNFYISRECQILTVNSKWAQTSMNQPDEWVFCRYEVSSAFQDPVRSMLLACFELTDKKTETGSGSLTFLTNNRACISSSFRRMPIHKSSSSTLLWSLGALKVFHWHDPTYLSTPALSHTRDSPSWASPGIIPTDILYLWMLIWASKEGVLRYTPMLYTLPPYTRQTPRNVILTGLFSISEHKNHQSVPASSHPFTGRVRTAKTPVSSSPNSLCALLVFVSVFICFRVKNKNLYLVLALWHGGELILPLYREQAEIQIPCRETLQIACSHKRTWWE